MNFLEACVNPSWKDVEVCHIEEYPIVVYLKGKNVVVALILPPCVSIKRCLSIFHVKTFTCIWPTIILLKSDNVKTHKLLSQDICK
jgi:hypothetical protein